MKTSQKSEVGSQKIKNIKSALLNLLPIIFFISAVLISSAFGNEGGEGHGEKSLFQAYLWPVINFLLLVFLLVFAMKKADIKGYFKKRTELIEQTLKEAKEARELAQKALAEVEERLKVKDTEVEEIIAAARFSGEKEKARLIEEGDRMKAKIIEQAKTNIDFEVKRAKEAIKEEAVNVAMELAAQKLKEKMTKDEQLKLLEESIAKLEGRN